MKLPRFLRKLLRVEDKRVHRRDSRLAQIEEMGFEVRDLSGWHDGKFASRRYHLVNPAGKLLDNDGFGYASSSEAFRAALADRDASEKD